jgi:TonB-linked SusC/RagA family outer membrane protein
MRNYKALLLFGLLCWFSSQAFGQQITGEVFDKITHAPIPGASITVSGNKGLTTDGGGKFTFQANGAKSFSVSSVGYNPAVITITGATNYEVSLEAADKSLDQVVVVGYGTQKKVDLTGSVAIVDVTKTFGSKPFNDPTKALQGIVPGLTIQYGNGGLTTGADIKIRGIGSVNGTSRPLILVDNVQTDDLSIINPQDIESISVLKDAASASIYGARAAFGVVLIKTKSGKKNQKSNISYSNNFSWNTPTTLPDFSNPVPELAGLSQAAKRAKITPETFGMNLDTLHDAIANWENTYAKTNTGLEMIKGQDWDIRSDGKTYFYKVWDPKKMMLNKYTFSQLHNLSFTGGSDKINYYVSGGYSDDGGIIKLSPDEVKKYNITASVNAAVTDYLDVNIKTLYRNYQYTYPYQYQDYWYYFWRWGSYFPYGTYQGNYFRVNSAYLTQAPKQNLSDNYSRIDLGATLKISKKLNFRADYTIGRDNALRHENGSPVIAWDFWTAGKLSLTNIASASSDMVQYTTGRAIVNTFNGFFTYQDQFTDHHVKVIGGVNAENDENINFFANRTGLLDPTQAELGLTYGTPGANYTSSSVPLGWSQKGHGKKAFAGYFGRINYDYKDKYLLEVNGRYDGSSYFPPDNRWAFFGSASAGYRLIEEDFMKFIKPTFSDLKLRASYGELGNQDVTSDGSNIYAAIMSPSSVNWVGSTGQTVQTIGQPQSIASALKWERIRTLDFGLDARLLDNHIGIAFDWYQRDNIGMIQSTTVPSTFGTSGPKINAGSLRTRGYEISIDANYNITKDLQVYGSIGFTDYKAVFTKWNNPNNSLSTALNYKGKTYGEIWGFETERFFTPDDFQSDGVTYKPGVASQKGLEQSGNFHYGPGDVKYKDISGPNGHPDDSISYGNFTLANHGDLKVIGNNQPRYIYNARLGATWKGFDIDIFIQGVGKRDWWGTGQTILPLWQSIDILYANQLDYWTPDHTNAKYPRLYPGNSGGVIAGLSPGGNNFYPQTKYLLNLAYCRLKNVTVGYAFSNQLLTKAKIQKLRIYFSGENLATISHVGAPIDPEITDGYTTGGISFTGRTWPFNKTFSAGAQITF